MDDADRISDVLAGSLPLTSREIANALGMDLRYVDAILWDNPDRFVWQPGHRWATNPVKRAPIPFSGSTHPDARAESTEWGRLATLRAVTLGSGLELRVRRRALDTDAFFTVRSVGNVVELTLNASHELFGRFPMPFDDSIPGDRYKALLELLLEAWALHEDSLSGTSSGRALVDARLLWGRRSIDILRNDV